TGRGPGEADVRRFSTSAATPSAACYGLALAALRRDLRTPPPACQYLCCHSVGCVLRPRPRCAPARPPHAASCVSGRRASAGRWPASGPGFPLITNFIALRGIRGGTARLTVP